MPKADGTILIDTRIDADGMEKGFRQLKSGMSSISEQCSSIAKTIAGTFASIFAVREIVRFGKACVDLGSDLQEVQNVVDVTFTTMSEQVDAFAKSAAKSAGLSETMAKRYVGTFGAMSKSFGFAESDAYAMSTALTQLSGDVASFYNITQDEAYTKLKSIFSGETESLKDLGVVMTQTALDSFAMANGFGKTTQQMTEQEKVALRYQFVMQQLSGASGDFLRTSDSWANQTRLLSLQFDQLKATIGQGLINALTPVIKAINTVLAGIQTIANAFNQLMSLLFGNAATASATSGALQGVADGYDSAAGAAEGYGNAAESAGKAAEEAKKQLMGFDEINKLSEPSSSSGAGSGGGGVSGGIGGFDIPDIALDANLQDNISPKIEAVAEKIRQLVEPLKNIDFTPATEAFGRLGNSISNFGDVISEHLGWAWENILVPLSKWAIEDLAPATVDTLTEAFNLLSAALDPLCDGLEALYEDLQPVFAFIGDTVILVLDTFREQFEKLAAVFTEKGPEITAIFDDIGDVIGFVWGKILKPYLEDMRKTWGIVFDFIGTVVADTIGKVIDFLYFLSEFVSGVFTGDWKKAWNAIADFMREPVNKVISILNAMISSVVDRINALFRLLSFNIDLPWGGSIGMSLPQFNAPQIPYLAQGAVIPPNKEFLAVLGDQTHGRNLELPEDLARQIVSDEVSGLRPLLQENNRLLGQLIEKDQSIEIDGDSVAKVVTPKQRAMRRAMGV